MFRDPNLPTTLSSKTNVYKYEKKDNNGKREKKNTAQQWMLHVQRRS